MSRLQSTNRMVRTHVLKPGQHSLSEAEVMVMSLLTRENRVGRGMSLEALQGLTGYSQDELSRITKSLVRKGLLVAMDN